MSSEKKNEKHSIGRTQKGSIRVASTSSHRQIKNSSRFGQHSKYAHEIIIPKEPLVERKPFVGKVLLRPMILSDFANLIEIPCSEIILNKLKEGKMYAKNHL